MPTSLTFADHLSVLAAAGSALLADATVAGLDAPVPTCPTWEVGALVAHQTMVHRWATAVLRGEDPDGVPNQTAIRAEVADLPGYYEAGVVALLEALRSAPEDLQAMTFLNDSPPPRAFWARRQAHETTVHGVDALAARLGRVPLAAETGVTTVVAEDGIDELLRGFFTRGRSKLFDGEPWTLVVAPAGTERRWVVHVDERLTVEPGDGEPGDGADVQVGGTPAQVYLGLWNRGDELGVTGRVGFVERWRSTQRVRWS